MSNNKKKNTHKKKSKRSVKMPLGQSLWRHLLVTLLIFFIIIGAYSLIAENNIKDDKIAISQLANEINAGAVLEIIVKGENLEITYKDETKKKSKKETGTPLTDTLVNYGVSLKELNNIKIDIQSPSGFMFWLGNLAPFLIPLLFIVFFIWFLSRQVKGAGMQAFSFGQSKARMTDPNDKNQKVTFKDVAGAKEAKQELAEIVDFLKNPKKFLEIGARIPKGIVLMGAPGTGKCVTGDTLVSTNKGLISIEEIPKYFSVNNDNTIDGLDVVSLDPNKVSFQKAKVSHWYDLDEQLTKKVVTNIGLEIEGTYEHPIIVVDQNTGDFVFSRIDQVKKDDWVAVGYESNIFGNYTKIPHPDVSYLLGVLTGNGCLTVKNRIILSTADNDVLDKVQKIAKEYLGKEFSKTSSGKYDYEIRSKNAKQKIRSWELEETYAECKKISSWVKIAPKEHAKSFLKGLFDTDGSVEKKGGVTFSSSSFELAKEVHLMLLNIGVVSRLYNRKKKYNNKLHYYLTIYGDFVDVFQKEINFTVKKKKERLAELCLRQRNTNINVIPFQHSRIKEMWNNALNVTDITMNREFYSQSLYKNVKRYINQDRMPSLSGMTTILDKISDIAPSVKITPQVQYLKNVASGKFFFTKINKITDSKSRVFDITVPHLHNFLGNGLINHNTLLARAVAGEASVPFFSISGSEFVEMFVGVGASRVRDLFKLAKKASPAIIFIDEIDAVGRVRGAGAGGGNDEREQTLNQILVEMDGFEPNEKVIVMAATNRPDVLDPALLRPGRFDRRVTIDVPDRKDREEILKIHAKEKPLADDVNFTTIAERTPGFSGADLYSLVNEAAILAAREDRKQVAQFDLIRSIEKVMLGPERKSHILSKREKEITAYHEAGHALIASILPYADPVHKISIISRGRAAGYTLKLPFEDRRMQSKREFIDDITVSLGGYLAEKMVFDDLTTGASNDLQVLTALARNMVTRYGMSEKMGPVALESDGRRAMFGEGLKDKEHSEKVSAEIDAEVTHIIDKAYKNAEHILHTHRKALDSIAVKLVEMENIERDEFEKLLLLNGIEPKKKKDIEHSV